MTRGELIGNIVAGVVADVASLIERVNPYRNHRKTQDNLRAARENMEDAAESMRMLTEAIRTGERIENRLPHKEGRVRSIELTEKGKQTFWGERVKEEK